MGTYYGNNSRRPTGDAGRGRHTGSAGWLGGKHRKNDGCFGAAMMIVGVGVGAIVATGYGIVELVGAIL